MNPITRKSMSKLVMQPRFRAVDQTHAEWQTFEKLENKRQMYGSQACNAIYNKNLFVCAKEWQLGFRFGVLSPL